MSGHPGTLASVSLFTSELTVTAERSPSREEMSALATVLVNFNEAFRPDFLPRELSAWIREPGGSPLGGALASHHWGWMHISHLWVPEHLRGQGFGRRLIEALEQLARSEGCVGVHVDTFDFQARGFYETLGYTRFGTIEDYPEGSALHFLSKRLTP